MHPEWLQTLGASLFALALAHTFLTGQIRRVASRARKGSVKERVFHFLGEVEVVFGLWAAVLFLTIAAVSGFASAVAFLDGHNFTEPLFVFVVMAVASTRPVIHVAGLFVSSMARLLPLPSRAALYLATLVLGPLLGSFITEPAAMTVTALILRENFFGRERSVRFKYLTIAVLFVNVSIGGVLTPYAAPPVLMVAGKWGWTLPFMLEHFGWKAVIAVVVNAGLACAVLSRELKTIPERVSGAAKKVPKALSVLHFAFLALIVMTAHHPTVFLGGFMFFLGLVAVTREDQDELRIRESLLVAFFLAGLVVIGSLQAWWLKPLIERLDAFGLFLGATSLTAITDNAALTFLGAQVEGLADSMKYALVAGAVAGGGLTVIANAPNPAGYSLLQDRFGEVGVEPLKLFLAALAPTFIAMLCLWVL